MHSSLTLTFHKRAGGFSVKFLVVLILVLAVSIGLSTTGANAIELKFSVGPSGRIVLAQTLDECIMRCAANRDLCQRSCSDQFDQCIANGGDDGSCGGIFRACYSDCGEVGFNRCVTNQCYSPSN